MSDFYKKVDRTSDKSKLTNLQFYSTELIYSMKYESMLVIMLSNITLLSILWKRINRLQSIAFYLSVVLNIVILLTTKDNHNFEMKNISLVTRTQSSEVYFYIMLSCQFPLLAINGLMFTFFALKNIPIINQ